MCNILHKATNLGRKILENFFVQHSDVTYLLDHANHQALLESAKLTTVSPAFIYRASLLGQAHILGALLYSPLEEALAAFACAHTVVLTGRGVAAHSAELARAWRCTFATSTASGRWRTDSGTRGTARLRGIRAPTTVNTGRALIYKSSLVRMAILPKLSRLVSTKHALIMNAEPNSRLSFSTIYSKIEKVCLTR